MTDAIQFFTGTIKGMNSGEAGTDHFTLLLVPLADWTLSVMALKVTSEATVANILA